MLKIIFSTDTAEPDIGLDVREETVQSLTDKVHPDQCSVLLKRKTWGKTKYS